MGLESTCNTLLYFIHSFIHSFIPNHQYFTSVSPDNGANKTKLVKEIKNSVNEKILDVIIQACRNAPAIQGAFERWSEQIMTDNNKHAWKKTAVMDNNNRNRSTNERLSEHQQTKNIFVCLQQTKNVTQAQNLLQFACFSYYRLFYPPLSVSRDRQLQIISERGYTYLA